MLYEINIEVMHPRNKTLLKATQIGSLNHKIFTKQELSF